MVALINESKRTGRKEREVRARTDLIIEIATELIAVDGFGFLKMEKIAELAEYSKGTIYQHFACKEDVLMEICNRGLGRWYSLCERAKGFDGLSRERLLAIHWAHHIFAKLNMVAYESIYLVRSPGISDKISKAAHLRFEGRIERVLQAVSDVVEDGVSKGDVVLPKGLSPVDLTYGFWSLHYGSMILPKHNLPPDRVGIRPPDEIKRVMLGRLLDGLCWKPLSVDHDFEDATKRILSDVFREEVAKMDLQV